MTNKEKYAPLVAQLRERGTQTFSDEPVMAGRLVGQGIAATTTLEWEAANAIEFLAESRDRTLETANEQIEKFKASIPACEHGVVPPMNCPNCNPGTRS